VGVGVEVRDDSDKDHCMLFLSIRLMIEKRVASNWPRRMQQTAAIIYV